MNFTYFLSLTFAVIVTSACSESSPSPVPEAAQPAQFSSADTSTELSWSAPAGWKKQQAGMMVLETYQKTTPAGPLKLAISAFPGTVGGDLANVNRWLRQAGKGSVTDKTLSTVMKQEVIAGRDWKIVNLANGENSMFVAYTLSGGKSWFFKITGPAAGIEFTQESFTQYLATVSSK